MKRSRLSILKAPSYLRRLHSSRQSLVVILTYVLRQTKTTSDAHFINPIANVRQMAHSDDLDDENNKILLHAINYERIR